MKTTLLFIVLFPVYIFSQDWVQIPDFPSFKRDDGVSFVLNNKAYCGTGLDDSFSPTRDFYSFDLITENWSTSQSLPVNKERQYATAVSYNGEGYVFGGSNLSSSLNDLWKYNPLNDSWLELAPLPDSGRAGSSNFILNDKWYIVGGKTASGLIKNEVWEYDFSSDNWLKKNDLPNAGLWRGVAFSNNFTAFIGLGLDSTNNFNTQFYQYDVALDSWLANTNFIVSPRTYPVYSQIGDSVFIYGGLNTSGQLLNDFYRIEIQNQTLTNLNSFTYFARKGGMAFCSSDAFYFTTGVTLTARIKETWKATYILGVNENDLSHNIIVYQDHGFLKINSSVKVDSFELYNSIGGLINKEGASNSLNVSDLTQGVYFYRIEINGNREDGKVFIQN